MLLEKAKPPPSPQGELGFDVKITAVWFGGGVSYSLLGTMKEMLSIKLFYRYLCVQVSSSPNWFPFQPCWRQITHSLTPNRLAYSTHTRKLLHCPVSSTDRKCLLQIYIWSPLCCDQISSRQGKDKLTEFIWVKLHSGSNAIHIRYVPWDVILACDNVFNITKLAGIKCIFFYFTLCWKCLLEKPLLCKRIVQLV